MVIINLKIMPESPDINLENLKDEISKKIEASEGKINKSELQEVAFGLKALNITLSRDESKGSTDDIEEDISNIDGVQNVEVTSVSRALG